MKERGLTVPEIIQIAGTRIALGAGIGLLLGDKLNKDQRKSAGLALLIVGVLSTIPLAINVAGKRPISRGQFEETHRSQFEPEPVIG
jgi:hypothetical protein